MYALYLIQDITMSLNDQTTICIIHVLSLMLYLSLTNKVIIESVIIEK